MSILVPKRLLKNLLSLLAGLLFVQHIFADTYVNGYFKKDGTYVEGHYKTTPHETNWGAYSTEGNSNPYTGSDGHKARDYSPEATNYGAGQSIYTGPKGGQYYINDLGRKVYVPKR